MPKATIAVKRTKTNVIPADLAPGQVVQHANLWKCACPTDGTVIPMPYNVIENADGTVTIGSRVHCPTDGTNFKVDHNVITVLTNL